MNQIAVHFGKIKKSIQNILFLTVIFSHPLYSMPLPGQIIGTAYQIKIGGTCRKACGLNVNKQDALNGRKPFKGIRNGKIFYGFL